MAFEEQPGKQKKFCQNCGLKLATGFLASMFGDAGHEFESGMYCRACSKTRHDIDNDKLAQDTRRRTGVTRRLPKDNRKKPPSFDILGGGGGGF